MPDGGGEAGEGPWQLHAQCKPLTLAIMQLPIPTGAGTVARVTVWPWLALVALS